MICPYLGMLDDSRTALGFPSAWNSCHHCKPVKRVALQHQKKYCLVERYVECPVFLQSPDDVFPVDLRNTQHPHPFPGIRLWWVILVVFILLAVILMLGGGFLARNTSVPNTNLPAALPLQVPSATPMISSISMTLTPIPLIPSDQVSSPVSRVTPIITRKPHGLEEWIGVNNIFIIYRVKQGWDLNRLSAYYNTTPAAIIAVNYNLITPLFPGQLVVIPINQTNVGGLPKFEVYRVVEDISVEILATQLDVEVDQLREYNGFMPNEQLKAKEWILIPRGETATK